MSGIQEMALSERRIQAIVWTLLLLMPLAGIAIDLLAPAMPGMARGLQVVDVDVKNIISIYLFGYAIGGFCVGFLTDAIGRQKLIRGGLLGFTIASLLPVFFPTLKILLLARLLQGITLSSITVVSRGVLADILPAEKLVTLGVPLAAMWGIGPIIGPFIGGYLEFYFGWEACFCFFAFTAFLGFIAIFIVIPETHLKRQPLTIKIIKNNLMEVLSHHEFIALAAFMGLTYSLILSFHTSAPFLIQNKFHYSPVFFGNLALYFGIAYLISTFLCRYLSKRFALEQLISKLIIIFLSIAVISVVLSYIFTQSILLLAITSGLMFIACGLIYPLALGKGLSMLRHIAGTATATLYLINLMISSLTVFLLSFINIHTITAMLYTYLVLVLLSAAVYWGMRIKTSANN